MTVEEWLGSSDKLSIDIWNKKYRDENESFDEWLERVSGNNSKVKEQIVQKKFLFGGRILANRGLDKKGKKITLSNCYVVTPPNDSIESIYDTAKNLARTFSYGGGCGVDISNLSPRGAKVNNAAKETSGAVSFMDTYSQVTEQIGQNGRRGALMISMDCHHPDIEEFIDIKTDLNKVTKANISVRITDDFMKAVKNNEEFELKFNRKETGEIISKKVNARDLFMKLAKNNWDYAEPGCLFWDRIENYNLLANTKEFKYSGTNPCAEEPLPAGGSCLLGSINLSMFVKENGKFDYDALRQTVHVAVEGLNEVLDEGMPLHPLEEQRKSVSEWRQIGLGIMGMADMLIKMKIRYGSPESIKICDKIGRFIAKEAITASNYLAKIYGAFPKCNNEEVCSTEFFMNHIDNDCELYQDCLKYGLRNSQLLTIAPTGTLSSLLGCSGGAESVFANYYTRKTESLNNETVYYKVYTPIVRKYMEENNIKDDKDLPNFFITSQEIDYRERIEMQSTWQKHIDASISSTVNLPVDFTVEETFDLYVLAWEKGLKGVTIYRDGCKRSGVLITENTKTDEDFNKENNKDKKESPIGLNRGEWKQKAPDTHYIERKIKIGCGKIILMVGWSDAEKAIQDFYVIRSGQGGCERLLQATSISMSGMLRLGGTLDNIEKAIRGVGTCSSFTRERTKGSKLSPGNSCGDAILKELRKFEKEMRNQERIAKTQEKNSDIVKDKVKEVQSIFKQNNIDNGAKCPECGASLSFEGGCMTCHNCGYSKCG